MTFRDRIQQRITDPRALDLYDRLVAEMGAQGDSMSEGAFAVIADLIQLEQVKLQLEEDVAKVGVIETYRNGRQVVTRPNKSVERISKIVDQQRKQLKELNLTPGSKRKVTSADDDADDFESF